jgi:hypothetical protein
LPIPYGLEVPVLADGTVLAVFRDFISSTVVVLHPSVMDEMGRPLCSAYGHIDPGATVICGAQVARGSVVGAVARNVRSSAPHHVHLSLGWWAPHDGDNVTVNPTDTVDCTTDRCTEPGGSESDKASGDKGISSASVDAHSHARARAGATLAAATTTTHFVDRTAAINGWPALAARLDMFFPDAPPQPPPPPASAAAVAVPAAAAAAAAAPNHAVACTSDADEERDSDVGLVLPDVPLVAVARHIHDGDVCAARLVCRQWRWAVDASRSCLKFRRETRVHDMTSLLSRCRSTIKSVSLARNPDASAMVVWLVNERLVKQVGAASYI